MVRKLIGWVILVPLSVVLGIALYDSANEQYASQYVQLKLKGPPPDSCEGYPIDPRDVLSKLTASTILGNIKLTCQKDECDGEPDACADWAKRSINFAPKALVNSQKVVLEYLTAHEIGHLIPGSSQNLSEDIIEQARANKFAITLLGRDAVRTAYILRATRKKNKTEEDELRKGIDFELDNLERFNPEQTLVAWRIVKEIFPEMCKAFGIAEPPAIDLLHYTSKASTEVTDWQGTLTVALSLWNLSDHVNAGRDTHNSARMYAAYSAALYRFYRIHGILLPVSAAQEEALQKEARQACKFVTRTECSEK